MEYWRLSVSFVRLFTLYLLSLKLYRFIVVRLILFSNLECQLLERFSSRSFKKTSIILKPNMRRIPLLIHNGLFENKNLLISLFWNVSFICPTFPRAIFTATLLSIYPWTWVIYFCFFRRTYMIFIYYFLWYGFIQCHA